MLIRPHLFQRPANSLHVIDSIVDIGFTVFILFQMVKRCSTRFYRFDVLVEADGRSQAGVTYCRAVAQIIVEEFCNSFVRVFLQSVAKEALSANQDFFVSNS